MYWQVFQANVQPGRRADLLQLSKAYVEECVAEEPGTLAFTSRREEGDDGEARSTLHLLPVDGPGELLHLGRTGDVGQRRDGAGAAQ